jgi:hypothetical protein
MMMFCLTIRVIWVITDVSKKNAACIFRIERSGTGMLGDIRKVESLGLEEQEISLSKTEMKGKDVVFS